MMKGNIKIMDLATILTNVVTVLTTVSREINDNNDVKRLFFGQYADGKPRSILDASKGEYMSPKERAKIEKERRKGGKKHRKDKYKKKYKKLKNKQKKHNKKRKKYAKKYKYTI